MNGRVASHVQVSTATIRSEITIAVVGPSASAATGRPAVKALSRIQIVRCEFRAESSIRGSFKCRASAIETLYIFELSRVSLKKGSRAGAGFAGPA
jgi:hypothetical protein